MHGSFFSSIVNSKMQDAPSSLCSGVLHITCFPDENVLCTNKKVLDEKERKFLLFGSCPFEIQEGYEKCMHM